jgi:S1-C subfamily serine protease
MFQMFQDKAQFLKAANPLTRVMASLRRAAVVAGAAGIMIASAACAATTAAPTNPPTSSPVIPTATQSVPTSSPVIPTATQSVPTPSALLTSSQVASKLRASTVYIQQQTTNQKAFSGSGFIYDANGLIVTNAHVVTGGVIIKVRLPGSDTMVSARLVGISPCDDLAIIQVEGSAFTPAALGDSDKLQSGDEIVVLGYPGLSGPGNDMTVTRGIISKLHTTVFAVNDALQFDAAITGGNSGGPVVNNQGQVVGVAVGGYDIAGFNFGIAISAAKPVLVQLAAGKKLNYVGWKLSELDKNMDAKLLKALGRKEGVFVSGVDSRSPVAKAGLEPDDVIIRIGDIDAPSEKKICDIVRSHSDRDVLSVRVLRGTELWEGEINGKSLTFLEDLAKPAATNTPVPPDSRPPLSTRPNTPLPLPTNTIAPSLNVSYHVVGYEKWGRPYVDENSHCLGKGSDPVRQFTIEVDVNNRSATNLVASEWTDKAALNNTGKSVILTCWYPAPTIAAGQSGLTALKIWVELNQYVSRVALKIRGVPYQWCFDAVPNEVSC